MNTARIAEGPHRAHQGLRHVYAIHALNKGVPLNMVSEVDGPCDDGNHSHLCERYRRGATCYSGENVELTWGCTL